MRRMLVMATLLLASSCTQRETITERHARATAEALVATKGPTLHDFHHMDWDGFQQVSPTEAVGTAEMVYRFQLENGRPGEERVPGRFIFHRTPTGEWTLDRIDFPNPRNLYHSISERAFAKVTSAAVPTGAMDPGATRDLTTRERQGNAEAGHESAGRTAESDSGGADGDSAEAGGSDAP